MDNSLFRIHFGIPMSLLDLETSSRWRFFFNGLFSFWQRCL